MIRFLVLTDAIWCAAFAAMSLTAMALIVYPYWMEPEIVKACAVTATIFAPLIARLITATDTTFSARGE